MSKIDPDLKSLSGKLAAICASYPTVRPQMVADVVRAVIDTLGSDLSVHETALLSQVADLGRIIEAAKEEIAALKTSATPDSDVSMASEELDAVVAHTADATNTILEACELLDLTADSPTGPDPAIVRDATMRIYEACSFQDITGQRITKVVNTLKAVEARVMIIVETFGPRRWEDVSSSISPIILRPGAHLLNGPQMPAAAMAQADIDALLADF